MNAQDHANQFLERLATKAVPRNVVNSQGPVYLAGKVTPPKKLVKTRQQHVRDAADAQILKQSAKTGGSDRTPAKYRYPEGGKYQIPPAYNEFRERVTRRGRVEKIPDRKTPSVADRLASISVLEYNRVNSPGRMRQILDDPPETTHKGTAVRLHPKVRTRLEKI